MPENLWKLSVIYLFEDTDFPIGGLQPRFCYSFLFIIVYIVCIIIYLLILYVGIG